MSCKYEDLALNVQLNSWYTSITIVLYYHYSRNLDSVAFYWLGS